jgi:hypothetical protein
MASTAEIPTAHRNNAADPPDPPRKPKHHEIKIELKGESASPKGEYVDAKAKKADSKVEYTVANAKYAAPATEIDEMEMHVGDTVSYSTDAKGVAQVRIVFPDCSPFREDHYKGTEALGGETLTLKTPGTMPSKCYLILTDGRVLGWSADYPDAGGDYHVRKP